MRVEVHMGGSHLKSARGQGLIKIRSEVPPLHPTWARRLEVVGSLGKQGSFAQKKLISQAASLIASSMLVLSRAQWMARAKAAG